MNIKQVFKNNPGYLKKGNDWLATQFNVSIETIKEARKSLDRPNTDLKILLFDIETTPLKVYAWGLYDQTISTKAIIDDWYMLTWAAKWYGEDKVYTGKLTPTESLNKDDKRITEDIWYLLDEADVIMGHNSNKFDIKKLNARFLMHGFNSPSPYHKIDTLQIARQNFAITSNKLDYLNEVLGITRKIENEGLQLWIDCMNGKQEALNTMETYNIGDVIALEELYERLRPWIKGHPNVTEKKDCCASCGSEDVTLITTFGKTSKYNIYRCNSCNSLNKDTKALKVDKPNLRGFTR